MSWRWRPPCCSRASWSSAPAAYSLLPRAGRSGCGGRGCLRQLEFGVSSTAARWRAAASCRRAQLLWYSCLAWLARSALRRPCVVESTQGWGVTQSGGGGRIGPALFLQAVAHPHGQEEVHLHGCARGSVLSRCARGKFRAAACQTPGHSQVMRLQHTHSMNTEHAT